MAAGGARLGGGVRTRKTSLEAVLGWRKGRRTYLPETPGFDALITRCALISGPSPPALPSPPSASARPLRPK